MGRFLNFEDGPFGKRIFDIGTSMCNFMRLGCVSCSHPRRSSWILSEVGKLVKPYHAEMDVKYAPMPDLQRWASDALCLDSEAARAELVARGVASVKAQQQAKDEESRPFDARTEVSADAKYIVRWIILYLWCLFALPVLIVFAIYELHK